MPEQSFDSRSTESGGFGIRETFYSSSAKDLGYSKCYQHYHMELVFEIFWHPFLWIDLHFGLSVEHLAEMKFLHKNGRCN